ncbi:hypothetical protein FA09DRAFT_337836 [Tilletiopsis washingtonensis]|uniref:Uncharacterized protein n=1 Tax=Tilletiopsis washingtonensis TaxID=58919 RepID=A0A316ZCS2_9BASI|nr:hypothetical protein FA09DRAFT_337836 [Tilletiopsis washingtonensis]PWN99116.1 hypothetical protein FA09DRAFT_337836 [Tilletiopsis washingtonensis]
MAPRKAAAADAPASSPPPSEQDSHDIMGQLAEVQLGRTRKRRYETITKARVAATEYEQQVAKCVKKYEKVLGEEYVRFREREDELDAQISDNWRELEQQLELARECVQAGFGRLLPAVEEHAQRGTAAMARFEELTREEARIHEQAEGMSEGSRKGDARK